MTINNNDVFSASRGPAASAALPQTRSSSVLGEVGAAGLAGGRSESRFAGFKSLRLPGLGGNPKYPFSIGGALVALALGAVAGGILGAAVLNFPLLALTGAGLGLLAYFVSKINI